MLQKLAVFLDFNNFVLMILKYREGLLRILVHTACENLRKLALVFNDYMLEIVFL